MIEIVVAAEMTMCLRLNSRFYHTYLLPWPRHTLDECYYLLQVPRILGFNIKASIKTFKEINFLCHLSLIVFYHVHVN